MKLYRGQCYGGPKDGEEITVKTTDGFLLVDQVGKQVWFYDWDQTGADQTDTVWGKFSIRNNSPSPLDEEKLELAVASSKWSVLAHG